MYGDAANSLQAWAGGTNPLGASVSQRVYLPGTGVSLRNLPSELSRSNALLSQPLAMTAFVESCSWKYALPRKLPTGSTTPHVSRGIWTLKKGLMYVVPFTTMLNVVQGLYPG